MLSWLTDRKQRQTTRVQILALMAVWITVSLGLIVTGVGGCGTRNTTPKPRGWTKLVSEEGKFEAEFPGRIERYFSTDGKEHRFRFIDHDRVIVYRASFEHNVDPTIKLEDRLSAIRTDDRIRQRVDSIPITIDGHAGIEMKYILVVSFSIIVQTINQIN